MTDFCRHFVDSFVSAWYFRKFSAAASIARDGFALVVGCYISVWFVTTDGLFGVLFLA
jgi:hypothetical protein